MTCSAPTRVLMDAYNTDVRPLLARAARVAGARPRPDRGVRASGYAETIVAERVGGTQAGWGRMSRRARHDRDAGRPVEPAGRRPAHHQLRRRQHLGQGHRDRPGHRATDVELLWVKGSGGDLGTLTEKNLAVLRLDRLRALVDVYPGVDREDEMVAAFDYCLHGKGGAAPSIDTAMHGLVDAAHVDHLHPDSGIALATAADGEALTAEVLRRPRWCGCRGAGPGSSSGWTSRRSRRRTRRRSAASSAGTASPPGATTSRGGRGSGRWRSSGPRRSSSPRRRRGPHPFGAVVPGTSRCPTTSAAPGRPRWPR